MPGTNTGQCWECSTRRLVCDLEKPACRKCRSRGVECPGYEHKPLKWMQPGQTRSKGARVTSRLRVSAKSPAETGHKACITGTRANGPAHPARARRTKAHSARGKAREEGNTTKNDDEEEPVLIDRKDELPTSSVVAILPNIRDRSTHGLLLQAVEYYNINISPDLVGTGVSGLTNPFYIPLEYAAYIPPTTAQTLICTALGHRILQTTAGFEDDRNAMAVTLRSHRGEAIRNLSGELLKCRDGTFLSVLSLLLCEIQHSISPHWYQHIDGAYAVLDMYGGAAGAIASRPLLKHLYRFFLYLDVLGSTTTPGISPDRIRRQLGFFGSLDERSSESVMTCIPLAPELLVEVIQINYSRSLRNSQTALLLGGDEDISVASDILTRILAFPLLKWAAEMRERATTAFDDVVAGSSRPDTSPAEWDWERIGRIYQAAVALYCLLSLSELLDERLGSEMVTTFRGRLLQDLQATSTDPHGHHRKMVLWPLAILGLTLDHNDEEAQQYVKSELKWGSTALGTASPLVALDLLERNWRSWPGDRGDRWEAMFDRPYTFAI